MGIEKSPTLTNPKDIEIERNFAHYLENNFDEAVDRYSKLKDSGKGRILNTDVARDLDTAYEANKSLSAAVHEPASAFIKELYKRKLAEVDPTGGNKVFFTAGGTGAGKSSAIDDVKEIKRLSDKAQIIYDTNMAKASSGIDKIDQALKAGKRVLITYVHRDPVDALVNGALPRAMRMKRTVPLKEHLSTHTEAPKAFVETMEHYKDNPNVKFRFIDNTRGYKKATALPVDFAEKISYNKAELWKTLQSVLENEYKTGKIDDHVYNGFSGANEQTSKGAINTNAP